MSDCSNSKALLSVLHFRPIVKVGTTATTTYDICAEIEVLKERGESQLDDMFIEDYLDNLVENSVFDEIEDVTVAIGHMGVYIDQKVFCSAGVIRTYDALQCIYYKLRSTIIAFNLLRHLP